MLTKLASLPLRLSRIQTFAFVFEEAAVLIQKLKPGWGGVAEASDRRDGISGKLREQEERGALGEEGP